MQCFQNGNTRSVVLTIQEHWTEPRRHLWCRYQHLPWDMSQENSWRGKSKSRKSSRIKCYFHQSWSLNTSTLRIRKKSTLKKKCGVHSPNSQIFEIAPNQSSQLLRSSQIGYIPIQACFEIHQNIWCAIGNRKLFIWNWQVSLLTMQWEASWRNLPFSLTTAWKIREIV